MSRSPNEGFLCKHKNSFLILLSIIFLPLDTLIVSLIYLFNLIVQSRSRPIEQNDTSFTPRRILVTGISMSKGLTIARLFHQAGHKVIGADFSPLACGRVSVRTSKFYALPNPDEKSGSSRYIESLLNVIRTEGVDMWVSCSAVSSAIEDSEAKEIVERKTDCKAIQFDVASTQLLHEKHSFIAHSAKLGLTVPDTHTIQSPKDVEIALRKAPINREYIMKPIGVDDANRNSTTLLSTNAVKEALEHVSGLKISQESPWILQQFIRGPEFCTHSLVINGEVKAFVACPSAELLMHYAALSADSEVSQEALAFTKRWAGEKGESFTGHLSFDFLLDESSGTLHPIECNPRAHTAVVLFSGQTEMVDAYLSLLDERSETKDLKRKHANIVTPANSHKYMWIGHDLVELLILPLLSGDASQIPLSIKTFFSRLMSWRDGTFETWDPLPFWWLYHVYWPAQFFQSWTSGKDWSRINVSTTKMFMK